MSRIRRIVLMVLLLCVAVVFGIGGYAAFAQPTSPVYICPSFTGCQNNQYLEVFDHLGAPIFSVGATGGPSTFGDNMRVFRPGNVFNPAVVISYTSPSGYGSTSCVAPAKWIAPQGTWLCQNGTWVRIGS